MPYNYLNIFSNAEIVNLIRKFPQIHDFKFLEMATVQGLHDIKEKEQYANISTTYEYYLKIYYSYKLHFGTLETTPKKVGHFNDFDAVKEIEILLNKEILSIDLKEYEKTKLLDDTASIYNYTKINRLNKI